MVAITDTQCSKKVVVAQLMNLEVDGIQKQAKKAGFAPPYALTERRHSCYTNRQSLPAGYSTHLLLAGPITRYTPGRLILERVAGTGHCCEIRVSDAPLRAYC